MRFRRRTTTDAGIPTSSMADIAFLLIIFFMVTSVFSATKGLELLLPSDDPADGDTEDAVLIQVYPDRILVDCTSMQLDEILPYLEPKLVRNPNKTVILYPDPATEYKDVMAVYDLLAETRAEGSDRSFAVRNVSIPTRSEIRKYVELFGTNPLETACLQ